MKPHIREEYFYDDKELVKKIAGYIGTFLQNPEKLKYISIYIEPIKQFKGYKFRTSFGRIYE